MDTIFSNAKSAVPAEEFIVLCGKNSISRIELNADRNFLLKMESLDGSEFINDFRNLLIDNNVCFHGFYLKTDFNIFEDIMLAKKCINLLNRLGGKSLRLELMEVSPESITSETLIRISSYLISVARFASYSAGGGENETTIRISFDIFSQPSHTFNDLLSINHSLLAYANTGISLDFNTCRQIYTSIIPEVNGFDLIINSVTIPCSLPLKNIDSFLSDFCDCYDGPVTVEMDNLFNSKNIQNIINKIASINFNKDRIDYSKVSYPSSVARFFTEAGNIEIEPADDIIAGTIGCWKYSYSVGEMGIANNGGIKLAFHHSTDWQHFQLGRPDLPGFVSIQNTGCCKLSTCLLDQEGCTFIYVKVIEGAFIEGDKIVIVIGDNSSGSPGSRAQKFQQTSFKFHTLVDATGKGHFFDYRNPPEIKITGGDAKVIKVVAPSIAAKDESFDIGVRVEDIYHNNATGYCEKIMLMIDDKVLPYESVQCHNVYSSVMRFKGIRIKNIGFHTITAVDTGGLAGKSNPIKCTDDKTGYRVFWGDIHCHLGYMDSVGDIGEFYDYAKNISFLDFTCHSEHMDSFSCGRQSSNDIQWQILKDGTKSYNEPGKFVTLLGYENSEEWDANLYFDCEEAPWHVDSFAPRLFEFAKNHNAFVVPHMTSYPQRLRGYNWSNYDSEAIPVAEIYSCHGSSEYFGGEMPLAYCEPGGFIVDALNKGCKIGFIGSGDGHDCMPGNAPWGPYMNGLVAIYAKELTRQAIFDAIKNRRCYASTNCRILGYFFVNGHISGSEIYVSKDESLEIIVEFYTCEQIETVDIVKNGEIIYSVSPKENSITFNYNIKADKPGDNYIYIRMKQIDGEMAWLSPVFYNVKEKRDF